MSKATNGSNMTAAQRDTILGFEIPMPISDVYIAVCMVGLFLPTVVVVHRSIAVVARLIRPVKVDLTWERQHQSLAYKLSKLFAGQSSLPCRHSAMQPPAAAVLQLE